MPAWSWSRSTHIAKISISQILNVLPVITSGIFAQCPEKALIGHRNKINPIFTHRLRESFDFGCVLLPHGPGNVVPQIDQSPL
jgi:hypothetical protein